MGLKRVRARHWTLLAVCRSRGDCLLLDFLDSLEGDLESHRSRMISLLDRVADHGPPRNNEQSKAIQGADGLFEFRAGRIRVLWFYGLERRTIICTHGFVKDNRSDQQAEIERAEGWKAGYERARKEKQ